MYMYLAGCYTLTQKGLYFTLYVTGLVAWWLPCSVLILVFSADVSELGLIKTSMLLTQCNSSQGGVTSLAFKKIDQNRFLLSDKDPFFFILESFCKCGTVIINGGKRHLASIF